MTKAVRIENADPNPHFTIAVYRETLQNDKWVRDADVPPYLLPNPTSLLNVILSSNIRFVLEELKA